MSNSSLVKYKVLADKTNYTKGRESKIKEITIHHMAGVLTAKQCGALFQKKNYGASSNYGIGNSGEIGLYVSEANTSWANADWEANSRAVTIETSNSKTGGDWPVSDKALNSLIKLVADIAKRNNLGKLVKGKNLTWHSMYSSTACPGKYLKSKIPYIIKEANNINYPPTPVEEQKVETPNEAKKEEQQEIINKYEKLIEKDGTYKIKLFKGETLIIK